MIDTIRVEEMLDRARVYGFDRRVLIEASKIPKGSTISYKELARLAGRPRAWRAVGSALNRNPYPILIPCHRVVRSDGRPGGYKLGAAKKRMLLAGESRKSRQKAGPTHPTHQT